MRRRVYDLWRSQRLRRLVRGVALVLVFGVLLANRPDCDRRQPNLTCTDISVQLDPGDCVDITNPCDPSGDFSRVDGFRLCDGPDGIFVRTNRSRSGTTRQICAAINVVPLANEPATFIYAAPREFGEGGITITTGTELEVEVAASASSVPPGDPVDLTSTVTGGTGPYTYSWSSDPAGQIGGADTALSNPTVNPTVNVTFTLEVVDDDGNAATDSVSVNVGLGLVLSLDVAIPLGGSTQLLATVSGGDGSYSYGWLPAAGLDFQTIADPLASPSTTTTYSVLVSDGSGASASGEVTVTVLLEAVATANPSTIDDGQTSQLDVQTAGGDGNYSYSWTPAATLTNAAIANPVASPSTTTTYEVTVADGLGQSVIVATTVTVNPVVPGGCMTWTFPDPLNPTTALFDGSACAPANPGATITCVAWEALIQIPPDPELFPNGSKPFSGLGCADPLSDPANAPAGYNPYDFTYFFGEGQNHFINLTIQDDLGGEVTYTEDF